MKKLLLLLIILAMTIVSNAQFKIGVGGGLNYSNVSVDIPSSISSTTLGGYLGFNSGVIMEFKLPVKLGIEVDVLFSQKGYDINYNTNDPVIDPYSPEMKMAYIDLPVVLKLYKLKILSIHGGVQYSHLLSATTKIKDFGESDDKDAYNVGYLSATFGLGLDVNRLHFSARYNFGATKMVELFSEDAKNNMLTLTAGIWLKK